MALEPDPRVLAEGFDFDRDRQQTGSFRMLALFDVFATGREMLVWMRVENQRTSRYVGGSRDGEVYDVTYNLQSHQLLLGPRHPHADVPPIPGPTPDTPTVTVTTTGRGNVAITDSTSPTVVSRQWGTEANPLNVRWDDDNLIDLS